MEFIRNFTQLRPRHRGCVATIGNFDGVHLGHRAVFRQLSEQSRALRLPPAVVIFEPQPQEFFVPQQSPPRLTRLREKLLAFHNLGMERVLCLQFNAKLAAMPAGEFIRHVLIDGLGVKYLIVGDDFRFGRNRQGDFATLQAAGQDHGFAVVSTPTFSLDGERVSSTRIREAMAGGNMAQAARLLGRPYTLCGRIAHGDKRGRQLGFPTANVHLHRRFSPIKGVFAVRMRGAAAEAVPGVANLGTRPTVDGSATRLLLEVHLFDFSGDLYGRYVEVEFDVQIREERRFPSFPDLQAQIRKDIAAARAVFGI